MAERSERHYERPVDTDITGVTIARFKRLSWGAIIAGTVIVLVTLATLSLLGMAIGFGTVDPATEANPTEGLATGAMIWWVISALIALFLGGWVAGRLGGTPRRENGMLHGLLTWGLSILVMGFLMTTIIGTIMGGALSVLQTGMTAASNVVGGAAANQEVGREARQQTQGGGNVVEDIRREFRTLLAQGNAEGTQAGAANVSDEDMNAALDRLFQGTGAPSQTDRQAAVNLLTTRANMSETQAQSTVDRWVTQYQATGTQPTAVTTPTQTEQAEQDTRATAQQVAETASTAATWTFIFMLLGALAAAVGGRAGAPREDVVAETTARA